MRLFILLPLIYAALCAVLFLFLDNLWLQLHVFYVISYPASHLFDLESLRTQGLAAAALWLMVGFIVDFFCAKAKR